MALLCSHFSPSSLPQLPAGTLGVGVARDKLLSSLCEFTLMDPPEEGQPGLSAQEGLLVTRCELGGGGGGMDWGGGAVGP